MKRVSENFISAALLRDTFKFKLNSSPAGSIKSRRPYLYPIWLRTKSSLLQESPPLVLGIKILVGLQIKKVLSPRAMRMAPTHFLRDVFLTYKWYLKLKKPYRDLGLISWSPYFSVLWIEDVDILSRRETALRHADFHWIWKIFLLITISNQYVFYVQMLSWNNFLWGRSCDLYTI
jgi:hypothetical protein